MNKLTPEEFSTQCQSVAQEVNRRKRNKESNKEIRAYLETLYPNSPFGLCAFMEACDKFNV